MSEKLLCLFPYVDWKKLKYFNFRKPGLASLSNLAELISGKNSRSQINSNFFVLSKKAEQKRMSWIFFSVWTVVSQIGWASSTYQIWLNQTVYAASVVSA